jgi:hypothetical protein
METPPLLPPTSAAWAERFVGLLGAQREEAGEILATVQQRLERAGSCIEQQIQRLHEKLQTEREESARVRAAHDAISAQLARAETQLADARTRSAAPSNKENQTALDDLQHRYAMALDDIRQARERNADLERQLDKARSFPARSNPPTCTTGRLDWESEKLRILAALEADGLETNGLRSDNRAEQEARRNERLGIQEVLRMTDEIVAAKDREIQDLRLRLAEQPPTRPALAAVQQAIDNDAAIQEERQRLLQLQKEWHEKQRQAEVELAVERAAITRVRAELEEQRQREMGSDSASVEKCNAQTPGDSTVHGRWLAQLGLTAADRARRRHF